MQNLFGKIFGRKYEKPKGLILYGSVQEVILVHATLVNQGFQVKLVAPPPEVRVGCDLAIEFEMIEQEALETLLNKEGIHPQKIVSTKEMLPGVLKKSSIICINGYLMCKAGNMKITIDKREHEIVNVSGGGCPDIPYIAQHLFGSRLEKARRPMDMGNSLCTFLLQIAFDDLKEHILNK
jgi:hypothetical protein